MRQPLDPKPLDPNALVGGMSELLTRTLGETIAVEAVRGAGLWKIEVDPNALVKRISRRRFVTCWMGYSVHRTQLSNRLVNVLQKL
jgi:hypothetical protein